jgi:hypothetical protein
MKLVYAISRWSNPNRAAALHIDNGEGKPLCGGAGRKAFSWEREEGEPTCKRCVRLANTARSGLAPAVALENIVVIGASH